MGCWHKHSGATVLLRFKYSCDVVNNACVVAVLLTLHVQYNTVAQLAWPWTFMTELRTYSGVQRYLD